MLPAQHTAILHRSNFKRRTGRRRSKILSFILFVVASYVIPRLCQLRSHVFPWDRRPGACQRRCLLPPSPRKSPSPPAPPPPLTPPQIHTPHNVRPRRCRRPGEPFLTFVVLVVGLNLTTHTSPATAPVPPRGPVRAMQRPPPSRRRSTTPLESCGTTSPRSPSAASASTRCRTRPVRRAMLLRRLCELSSANAAQTTLPSRRRASAAVRTAYARCVSALLSHPVRADPLSV